MLEPSFKDPAAMNVIIAARTVSEENPGFRDIPPATSPAVSGSVRHRGLLAPREKLVDQRPRSRNHCLCSSDDKLTKIGVRCRFRALLFTFKSQNSD